jgi:hypothetical protein
MLSGPCPICDAKELMEIKEMNHDIGEDTLKIDFTCFNCKSFFQFDIEDQEHIMKYLQKVENHPEKIARDVLIIKKGE